jgi:2-hydroxychromene-2-carboxylate isomerase
MTDRARVFFSFRSPFSWLALELLLRAVPGAFDEIEFIPFWEPDADTRQALEMRGAAMHYVAMSKAKHLYILHDTQRLARRLGMKMTWPVDIAPWWEPAHLGWLEARRLGRGREFYDAVIAARWLRGENISEPAVVRAAARSAGLDEDRIAAATHDPRIRAEGVACLAQAYEDDIFGVPFFRLGRNRFWGFDRVAAFLEARAQQGEVTDPLTGIPLEIRDLIGAFDSDTAGGCG